MDVHAIRTDLAAIATQLGFNGMAFAPESLPDLPAVVVGNPRSIEYGASLGLALLVFPVTVVASGGDWESAQLLLDAAASTGGDGSLWNAINASVSDEWRSANVVAYEPVTLVTVGAAEALGFTFVVEVRSQKAG